jgi:hypothetical protein
MAIASANAIAKMAIVCTFEAASGFLPIASTDFEPIQPMASAGVMVPMPIAMAVPMIFMLLTSIINNFLLKKATFCFRF